MRIAIASDDGQIIASHTGQCRSFVIFDIDQQSATRVEHRANTFTGHARGECDGAHEHGAGHHSHGPLVEAISDCRVLVTRGLGPRLVADLAAHGIDAYVCQAERVEDAARLFAQGQLPRAAGTGCCRHH